MSLSTIIPPIGTSGIWYPLAPFNTSLQLGVPYTLISIRTLSEIIASDSEPEVDYYTANGIGSDIYERDLINNTAILSLQNGNGAIVHIPSSFFTTYPDIGGVIYRVMALTVNLGALPDTMSLSNLISKVASDVTELIGVEAIVKPLALSEPTMLSSVDAATVEAARVANIGTTLTDYTKYVKASNELASARQKIILLEKVLKQLHANGVELPAIEL